MKTDSGSRADIIVKMKDLKLSGMVESYDEIIANTARIKGTINHALYELLKAESKKRTMAGSSGPLEDEKKLLYIFSPQGRFKMKYKF